MNNCDTKPRYVSKQRMQTKGTSVRTEVGTGFKEAEWMPLGHRWGLASQEDPGPQGRGHLGFGAIQGERQHVKGEESGEEAQRFLSILAPPGTAPTHCPRYLHGDL